MSRFGVARLAVLLVFAVLAFGVSAKAADQTVSGTIAPTLGVALDGTPAGTDVGQVTRERRGDVTYVTIVPR